MTGELAPARTPSDERPLAQAISVLLIVGVGASATVIALGLVLLVTTGRTGYHQGLATDLLLGRAGSVTFPTTVDAVLRDALALKPFAIIELGTLMLVATPVARVAASVLLFLAERDYLYAAITLVVLALLLLSLFWLR